MLSLQRWPSAPGLRAHVVVKDGHLRVPLLSRRRRAPAARPPCPFVRLLGMLSRARAATPVGPDALRRNYW
jgi:hypothetical protein